MMDSLIPYGPLVLKYYDKLVDQTARFLTKESR